MNHNSGHLHIYIYISILWSCFCIASAPVLVLHISLVTMSPGWSQFPLGFCMCTHTYVTLNLACSCLCHRPLAYIYQFLIMPSCLSSVSVLILYIRVILNVLCPCFHQLHFCLCFWHHFCSGSDFILCMWFLNLACPGSDHFHKYHCFYMFLHSCGSNSDLKHMIPSLVCLCSNSSSSNHSCIYASWLCICMITGPFSIIHKYECGPELICPYVCLQLACVCIVLILDMYVCIRWPDYRIVCFSLMYVFKFNPWCEHLIFACSWYWSVSPLICGLDDINSCSLSY